MLSRHAEVLFWVGRYLQRAAQTGLLVSITSMSQVERHASADPWRELLDVLYQEEAFRDRHDDLTADGVLEFLVLDRANPGSIASSVAAARDGLRNVRDLVPLDLLEAVNVGHSTIMSTTAEDLVNHPVLFLDGLHVQSQRIAGVIHDSMVRSDGYRFLVVGRYLQAAFAGTPHMTALRALGRLRATIEYGDVPSVIDPELGEFIDRAEAGIRDVSDSLRNDLFAAASIDLHSYEVV